MPAVFQAIGAQSAGTGSLSVSWPAHAAQDLGLMVIETGGEGTTLTPPGGWTAVFGSPVTDVATNAGSKLQVWYFYAQTAAEAPVTIGDSGDHQVARIITFRGVDLVNAFDTASVAATKTPASTTVTWNSITTVNDGALIVLIATRPDDSTSVAAFSNPVNANLTDLVERGEAGTNAGHGGGFVIVTGTKATAGATGTTTMTGPNTTNAELVIALRRRVTNLFNLSSPYTNTQTFYAPTVQRVLVPSLFTNEQTFFAPTVTASNTLTPALYTNNQVFYAPTVAQPQSLSPALYTNAQTFFNATVNASNTLAPALYTNNQTFYSATVSTTKTLEPALYTNAQTFFSATATATYTLAPGLYTNAQTFFAPTLTKSNTLAPALYTNNQTFFDPTVTAGAVALTPDLYTNIQAFFAPTVTTGAVALTADLYTNDQTFYAAAITQTGGPQFLLPNLYANAQTFYSPTITTGAVDVAPGLYTNGQTFFAPTQTNVRTLTQVAFYRTNRIRNSTIQGVVAGAPGTLPTNWNIANLGNLNRQIVGSGVSNGLNYVDIRFSGTTSTTQLNIRFDVAQAVPANNGQAWTHSVWSAVVGGNTANILQLAVYGNIYGAGPAYLSSLTFSGSNLSTTSTLTRTSGTGTISVANAAYIQPQITFLFNSGVAIDITLRIAAPQLEYGSAATEFIPTSGAAVEAGPPTAFYAPAVTTSYTLAPALYTNNQTFYAPSVSTGSVTLAPALYTNTQTFFAPAVTTSNTLQPQLVTNDQVFYSPTVAADQELTPGLYTNAQTFFAPTVSTSYTLAPQGYVDDGYVNPGYVGPNTFSTQIFYAPAVTSTRVLLPSLATNTSTFFAAAVENSAYTITKAQALRLRHIWQLHGLSPAPLVVGPDSRIAGDVVQTVTESVSTTTVATTSAGTVFSGDPGLMIDELAALHGLTASLVVSPTTRTAGAISQAFTASNGTTTVTRQ